MSEKILRAVEDRFRHSVDSTQYTSWRIQAAEDQDFYDGNQLSADDLKALDDRGQPAIIINEVAPKVDSIMNQELQNKTKTGYSSRTFDPTFEQLAEGMTTLGYNIQENADTHFEMSDTFEDQLKAGIGWIELDVEEGMIITPRVDPFMMVWDTDDTTKQLTCSSHVNRMKWYTEGEAKRLFKDKSKEISKLISDADGTVTPFGIMGGVSPSDGSFSSLGKDREPFGFVDTKMKKVLIVEQQYKKPATKYRYLNEVGQQKETFDKDDANKFKAPETEVERIETFQIWRAFFTEGILFEHMPHSVQIGEFTIVPTIHKRAENTHVPYGIITNSKDPQREVNKRRSKTMHLLNTRGVVMESGAVDDKNDLAKEISRPDFIIEKNKGKDFDIQDNLTLADSQVRIMEQAKQDIATTMGVFNENIGQQTNVTSGIGIQRRQSASIGNKGFAFNNFDRFKKRFGRILGVMMQTVFSEQQLLQVFGEDGSPIILNKPYKDDKGNQLFENDLSTLYFGVHVTQLPNFEADPEVLADNLTNMAMNGQLQVVLQSPSLAKRMGLHDIDQIQQEMQAAGGVPSPDGTQDGTQ